VSAVKLVKAAFLRIAGLLTDSIAYVDVVAALVALTEAIVVVAVELVANCVALLVAQQFSGAGFGTQCSFRTALLVFSRITKEYAVFIADSIVALFRRTAEGFIVGVGAEVVVEVGLT
jgi:hypothetical protein